MTVQPLQLAFYKGVKGKFGALQLNPQRPHYYVKGNSKLKNFDGFYIPDKWKVEYPDLTRESLCSREGCVFLEVCSAKGPNEYDWENKIRLALSVTDMGKMLAFLLGRSETVNIMHDPGAKSSSAGQVTKKLSMSAPKGLKAGCMVNVQQSTKDGESVQHTVPLSCDEVVVLTACLQKAIPAALSWE